MSHESLEPTCILWSGGKDCFLALLLAQGVTHDVKVFVTFVPKIGGFRCHPLPMLEAHSAHFGLPHEFIVIDINNWRDSYATAFKYIRNKYQISAVLSGDIVSDAASDVYWPSGVPEFQETLSWWRGMLSTLNLTFSTPLGQLYVEDMFELHEQFGIVAVVTGMSDAYYVDGFIGEQITLYILTEVFGFDRVQSFDLCGEKGEYHTTVVKFGEFSFCHLNFADLTARLSGGVWALDWESDWMKWPILRISPSNC